MAEQNHYFREGWQNYANPNEYVYIPGYGFSPRPPQMLEKIQIRRSANAAGMTVISVFLIYSLAPGLFELLYESFFSLKFGYLPSPFLDQLMLSVSYCLAFSIPFWVYCAFVHMPIRVAIPVRRPTLSIAIPAVFIDLGASVMGILMATTISTLFSFLGIVTGGAEIISPADPSTSVLYYAGITLFPAIFEEFAFRGIIMQSLRRFGDGFALIVSAILFSLVHVNLEQMPNAFLLGIVIGYFVIYTGSIWTGVLMHFVNNTMVLLIIRFAAPMDETMQAAVMLTTYAFYLIAGIASILFVTKNNGRMFTLVPARTVSSEGNKLHTFFSAPWVVAAVIIITVLTVGTLEFA